MAGIIIPWWSKGFIRSVTQQIDTTVLRTKNTFAFRHLRKRSSTIFTEINIYALESIVVLMFLLLLFFQNLDGKNQLGGKRHQILHP